MQSVDAIVFQVFDYWSTHCLSKRGIAFAFPVVIEKLAGLLGELRGRLPDESVAIDELQDYLGEFRQSYDGVDIANRHPFNLLMLSLLERLRSHLPTDARVALENVRIALA